VSSRVQGVVKICPALWTAPLRICRFIPNTQFHTGFIKCCNILPYVINGPFCPNCSDSLTHSLTNQQWVRQRQTEGRC
jgi:hypothetical protein